MENQISSEGVKKSYLPVIILVVLVLVGVSAYFLMRKGNVKNDEVTGSPEVTAVVTATPTPVVSGSPEATTVSSVKTFNVTGSNFSFSPKEIKVNKGDTVKIVFKNDNGMHNWVLDEFNVKTPVIQSGQTAEVQFVADKTGTFQYYCSVGSHRAMGMWGNLIVQ